MILMPVLWSFIVCAARCELRCADKAARAGIRTTLRLLLRDEHGNAVRGAAAALAPVATVRGVVMVRQASESKSPRPGS